MPNRRLDMLTQSKFFRCLGSSANSQNLDYRPRDRDRARLTAFRLLESQRGFRFAQRVGNRDRTRIKGKVAPPRSEDFTSPGTRKCREGNCRIEGALC